MESDNTPDNGPRRFRGLFSWALYDWANSAFVTVIQTFVFAAYFTRQVAVNETRGSALWGYAVSAAGLVVALSGPLLGAVTDQYGPRKPALAGFTGICVTATALLWLIRPQAGYVVPAMVLVAVAIVAYEAAAILYNAMLAKLAPSDRIGRWSGWGWALGYSGGLICLVVCLGVLTLGDSGVIPGLHAAAQPVRLTFLVVAAWYLLFSLPLFIFTPDVPATGKRLQQAVRGAFRQLAQSVHEVRKYGHIVRFLIARMIYVDGLATLFAFGGVYAAGTFDMTGKQVVLFGIVLNVTAGLGAAGFAWVDDRFGSKPTVAGSLCGLIVCGGAMLLVQSQCAFWGLGLVLGLFVGPVQAASRSWLARAAPEHLRNQMFGLYAFSGKATAFVGPFLVGAVTQWTQSQRAGMAVIIVLLSGGLALFVTVPRARQSQP